MFTWGKRSVKMKKKVSRFKWRMLLCPACHFCFFCLLFMLAASWAGNHHVSWKGCVQGKADRASSTNRTVDNSICALDCLKSYCLVLARILKRKVIRMSKSWLSRLPLTFHVCSGCLCRLWRTWLSRSWAWSWASVLPRMHTQMAASASGLLCHEPTARPAAASSSASPLKGS